MVAAYHGRRHVSKRGVTALKEITQIPAGDYPHAVAAVGHRLGDVDGEGGVNQDDVDQFVNVLLGQDVAPAHMAGVDINLSGAADGLDVQLFVDRLVEPWKHEGGVLLFEKSRMPPFFSPPDQSNHSCRLLAMASCLTIIVHDLGNSLAPLNHRANTFRSAASLHGGPQIFKFFFADRRGCDVKHASVEVLDGLDIVTELADIRNPVEEQIPTLCPDQYARSLRLDGYVHVAKWHANHIQYSPEKTAQDEQQA